MSNRQRAKLSYIDKGGVGKTTIVAHFGRALNDQHEDVLLIDLAGKQADLAKTFDRFDAFELDR